MGEEEKKPEEKMEEKKPAEDAKKPEEKKEEAKPAAAPPAAEEKKDDKKTEDGKESKDETPPPPPPPQEIVLKVFMHCEGCARKVRRCLKGFEGVEDVTTDCKTSKVVVKGEKADPLKVLARVQRKSHRQVELISPIPKPPAEEEKKPDEKPKPEEKKEEPQVVTVVLKVFMHCEACAMEIKRRIQRMKGVESAEPDLKSSEVTVKGMFEPATLVEYVYKRTGKHAVIVRQDPEKKDNKDGEKKGEESKDEKKGGDGGGGEGDKEKKGDDAPAEVKKEGAAGGSGEGEGKENAAAAEGGAAEETAFVELKKNEYLFYPQRQAMDLYAYHPYAEFNHPPYAEFNYPPPQMFNYPPPQMFSDENPNACSVM